MNFSQILKKLELSEIFRDFKEKNPDAFLCAGFFILDFKQNNIEYSLDYRNEKQIFTFKIPISGEIKMLVEDNIELSKNLPELNRNIKVEIENLNNLVDKELLKNQIASRLEKIIAVLQKDSDEKTIWNLTCMCAGFAILTIKIDAVTGNVLLFEKRNLFDFIKK